MSSQTGATVRMSIFGQSHSSAIGCVVEGLPSGFAIDVRELQAFLDRRAPGRNPWDTQRKEADRIRILSGLNGNGETCGTPFAAIIENNDTRSGDYSELSRIPRPGHADFAAWAKWGDAHDTPGGGHFSGRLTAPMAIAGGVCMQILAARGIRIAAHLAEAAGIADEPFCALDNSADAAAQLASQMDALEGASFPVLSDEAGEAMRTAILAARDELDSVGGIVECVVCGLPAGVGAPHFDGLENTLARELFGIPAVKGVEFGAGFAAARLRGSANNDPYEIRDGAPVPATNNAGGILGGISTGAPLVFSCAFKPISSISREQRSVDLSAMEETTLAVRGRHDPCAAVRAVPVVEAIAAHAVLDALLSFPPER